jgi:O-antigen/teichoic acid export membrane protein
VFLSALKTLGTSRIDRSIMIRPAAQAASHDEAEERAQRGTRQFLLARLCVVLFGYGATAILTRQLGPSAYGIYGVIISQVLWIEILNNAGMAGAIAKLMADGRYNQNEIERSARALLVALSVLLLAVCWLTAPRVASLMRIPDGAVLFRIALIDLPFMAIFTCYDGILNGRRAFGVLAGAHVLYGSMKLVGVAALVVLGLSLQRAFIVFVFSTCVVCVALTIRYRLHGFRPSSRVMREMAWLAAPMALYLVANQVLLSLDLWSLKALWEGKVEVVGRYVAAMNVAKILMVVPGAQAGVLFASIAWALAAHDTARVRRHIHDATRFTLIIGAAAFVILSLDASEILSLLFSRPYMEGGRFLPLQLAGFCFFGLLDAFAHVLMAVGRRWFVAAVLIATVPLVWLSNYLLIPRIGPMGAATSMVMGLALACCLIGAMVYRHFGSLVQIAMLLRVLVATSVVGLMSAAIVVQGPMLLLKLPLLGISYLLVLYFIGEITEKDFKLWRKSPAEHSV